MGPYVLMLMLVTRTGEPTEIVEVKPTFAECNQAASTVAAALANVNAVISSTCQLQQRKPDAAPGKPEKPA